jgi:hypothetical protein
MATDTTTSISDPAFHADDLDQTTEYRSLSVLAIVGLILGLASPFCLAAPLLMVIPLVGAAVSIIALRQIAASDGALAGQWTASIGLVLCVACAIGAMTHKSLVRSLRSHQAEVFGEKWIGLLLSGKVDEAFRLTVDSWRGQLPPEPAVPAPAKSPQDVFKDNPVIKELAAAGAKSKVRFGGTVSYEQQSARNVRVGQKFVVTPEGAATASKPESGPIELLLTVSRSRIPGELNSRWLVSAYADARASTNPPVSQ